MNKIFRFLFLFLMSAVGFTSYAYDFEADGIYYNITSASDLTCEITYESKPNDLNYIGCYSGDFVIPDQVQYRNKVLKVTGIGAGAFYNCSALESVEIPNSITRISTQSFYNCTSLKEVVFPNSIISIGRYAFAGCSSMTEIELPNSVVELRNGAFSGCTKLGSIKLSQNLKRIDYDVFNDCSSLESLIIPGSVTQLVMYYEASGDCGYSFMNCDKLKNLSIEYGDNSLKFCGYYYGDYSAFAANASEIIGFLTNYLTTFFIDRTLYPIPRYFDALKEVYIGEHLTSLSSLKISNAKSLEKITCYAKTPPTNVSCTTMQYVNLEVKVPKGTLTAYQIADGWKDFWNMSEMDEDESGIDIVISENERAEIARYNLQGQKVSEDYQGMVIVRYSDGSTKKLLNK